MTNPVQYYDSPESGRWINRFDVLWIRRDHRRVLNAQPKRKEKVTNEFWASDDCKIIFTVEVMIHDFKVLSN